MGLSLIVYSFIQAFRFQPYYISNWQSVCEPERAEMAVSEYTHTEHTVTSLYPMVFIAKLKILPRYHTETTEASCAWFHCGTIHCIVICLTYILLWCPVVICFEI